MQEASLVGANAPAATAVVAPPSSSDRLKHAEIARSAPSKSESWRRGGSRGPLAFTAVLCVLKQRARFQLPTRLPNVCVLIGVFHCAAAVFVPSFAAGMRIRFKKTKCLCILSC